MPERRSIEDQAAGLRRLLRPAALHILPVAGGGHGGERAGAVLNLATAAGFEGYSVVVLDQSKGDLAQALGLRPRYDLRHWLEGEKPFHEVACTTPHGVRVVSASRGLTLLAERPEQAQALYSAFSLGETRADLVLINVQAPQVAAATLPGAEGDILLVSSAAPPSLTAAYAHIKQLVQCRGFARYRLLLVNVSDEAAARHAFGNMAQAAKRFLAAHVVLGGTVPHDPCLRQAERSAQSLFGGDGGSPAARAYRRLAAGLAGWNMFEVGMRPHRAAQALM
jgi:flagellar biosynthesis protein FlhG